MTAALAADEFPGVVLAMPIGSKWRVYNHKRDIDVGEITIVAHRRSGLEVYLHDDGKVMTLPYPANANFRLQGDHIRIGDNRGNLMASYAPA